MADVNAERRKQVESAAVDKSTYWGRVQDFFTVTDMRTLLTSSSELSSARRIVEAYKSNSLDASVSATQVIHAQKVVNAIIHPDLGTPIFPLFRMSCQVPVNMVLVAFMLQARSIPAVFAAQTANQVFNVCVNHANRNASNEMSTSQLATSTGAAIGSALITSIGLNEGVKRAALSPGVKSFALRFVPFIAVAVANICNTGAMRWMEMQDGIDVKDSEGNVLGRSPTAGRLAVQQTIICRVSASIPVMAVTPIIMFGLESFSFVKSRPKLVNLLTMLVTGAMIWLAVPLTLAIFPQQASVPASQLEPKYHNLVDRNGRRIDTIYFNKGL